jgi:hypothetical protein
MTTEAQWMTILDELKRHRYFVNRLLGGLNRIEEDLIKLRDEHDALGEYTERLRMELSRHGWGDFHYGGLPIQDPDIVALLNERGTNGSRHPNTEAPSTTTTPSTTSDRGTEQRQNPVGRRGGREESDGSGVLHSQRDCF